MRSTMLRPTKLAMPLVGVCALVAGACGGETDDGASPPTTDATSTTSTIDTTTTTTTTAPGPALVECENPDGFTISYPEDWATNTGDATGDCSYFAPEPFEVEAATDARPAPISAYVDNVPYFRVASPTDGEQDRAATVVDGHQAVRIERTVTGESLWPEGTPITTYAVDLELGVDDGEGTLIVDAIGLSSFDHDAAVDVLDRMVPTIELDASEADDDVVARYEGGGQSLVVHASETDQGEICLTFPPEGPNTCFEPLDGPDDVAFADLAPEDDLTEAFGGIAGANVHRVDITETGDGDETTFGYLPVPIARGAETQGWAVPLPVGVGEITGIVWYDAAGNELGRAEPGGETPDGPDPDDTEPVGSFTTEATTSDSFPAGGPPAYLETIDIAPHDGFDRTVFEFLEAGGTDDTELTVDDLSYEVAYVEETVGPSGQPTPIGGGAILEVTMTPASGVDLTGETPVETYTGQDRIPAESTPAIVELARVEDFENVLTWGIGVTGEDGYAVTVLDDPLRLVVDIAHAG
ncbi:MAG: hypothetical protein S0880_15760 [Actinomycetota bacterium]|nr:hypothetical protein [Actinomycetota bacterium]